MTTKPLFTHLQRMISPQLAQVLNKVSLVLNVYKGTRDVALNSCASLKITSFFAYLHRTICICSLALLSTTWSLAQQAETDTSGYEHQRQKVNELLAQRSARFGQFDESLKQRTGIFGLKTKKDMQASIDILKQIVLTDNDIFRETKQLLDYKDFEKSQVEQQATEFDERINGYIRTISKLQQEQERLRSEVNALQKSNQFYFGLLTALSLFVIGVVIYLLLRRQKLTKA